MMNTRKISFSKPFFTVIFVAKGIPIRTHVYKNILFPTQKGYIVPSFSSAIYNNRPSAGIYILLYKLTRF